MAGNQVPYNQLTAPANKYGSDGSGLPSYQNDFIQKFAPYAMLAASQTGIPARFLLAEASIETDWGRSGSATKFNNIFGIKASPGQIAAGAQVAYMPTREFVNGQSVMVNSPFMVYKSPEDGFNAFTEKLQKTKWPDQKALLNYRSADPFAEDGEVEKGISDAFGRSSYLTMEKINQGMLDRMARMPSDLRAAGFNTAVDFNKASNDLAGLVGYDASGHPDLSNGLDNDGLGSLGVNGITFNRTPEADGTLDYLSNQLTGGLRQAGSTIADAYGNLTGRLPSVSELAERVDSLKSGATNIYDQLTGIAGSDEAKSFQQQTGIDPSRYAIDDIYRLGLGRGASDGDLTASLGVLQNGGSLNGLAANIGKSQEGQTYALNNFYGSAFGRDIDSSGLQNGLDQLSRGASLQAVETDLLSSPEAQAQGVTRDQIASMLTPSYYAQPEGPGTTTGTLGFGGITTGMQGPTTTTTGEKTGIEVGTLGSGTTSTSLNTGTEVGTLGAGTTTTGEKSGTEVGMQGPTTGETTTAWSGRFDPNAYLGANQDVAAAGMDALSHYLTYGYNEGRALDTQGDRISKGFDASAYLAANPDVAADHQDALAHYVRNGAAEGRAEPIGTSPYSFSGFNVSQGAGATGNGSFSGHFDSNAYLAANPDVAAAHMDPLTHYETYGFNEGRALDTAGHRINQAFDPNAYLAQNQDVAKSGMDPLKHYLEYGAAEGRPLPTGSNPYSFSNFNVAQGAGATGNGGFGLGGIISTGGMGGPTGSPNLPDMGGGFNVSGGVQNGSFGFGGITAGSSGSSGGGIADPYGFSGANVGGGLGATSQSMGGFYPAGGGQGAGGGGIDPYGFSSANVSGFNANGGGGGAAKTTSDPNDWGSGEGLGETTWATDDGSGGFNAQASEMSFLRGQLVDQAAKDARSASSGDAGKALVALGATQNAQLDATGAANAARQFAGIQGGLGITPVTGTTLFTPTPVIRVANLAGSPMLGFL